MKQLQKLKLLRLGEDTEKYITNEKGFKFIGKYEKFEVLLKS